MPAPDVVLAAVQSTLATLWGSTWTQVDWGSAPSDSSTTDRTFAFAEPRGPRVLAAGSSVILAEYSMDVRLVVRPPPQDPLTSLQMTTEALVQIARAKVYGAWPVGVAVVMVDDPTSRRTGGTPEAGGAVEVRSTIRVQLEQPLA